MELTANDVNVAKEMGFDHIKILFTANSFISGSGLNMDNMWYVDKVVNTALTSKLPVLICIHPEPDFKFVHLGSKEGFDQMLGFYSEFSRYIAERWKPEQIALQLMTEPHGKDYGPEFDDWNVLYRQMVQAVRKYMPDHTLVIPGNRSGSVYGLTSMTPIDDHNVYYSFTTHEPFQVGMGPRLGDYMGAGAYWRDISFIPWPTSPEIVAERMDKMLSKVSEKDRPLAQKDLIAYGSTRYDKQWLKMKARYVKDWIDDYGGDVHVMVVEFGVIDHVWVKKYGASLGVYPEERFRLLYDLRKSFEDIGMGWVYWSFNEACTVLNPNTRVPYGATDISQVEEEMLLALGLK